ncbi:MAG: hypothetical protein ACUVXJ_06285 [Phycisphaerae bacterium]
MKKTSMAALRCCIPVVLTTCGFIGGEVSALPAFPGAQGFGSQTPGGRGGRGIEVTTLDDNGPGCLREALSDKGPRTIVFHVGGAMILFDGVEDARLRRPGVIDGRGDEGLPPVAAVAVRNARSIVLVDLVVRNPCGMGIEVSDSRNVRRSRSKVMAVGDRKGIGGLHVNRCESVTCERSFVSGSGAGICI